MLRAWKIILTILFFIPLSGHADEVCNIAAQADSYVLAMSWQPAFCQGHPDKEECKRLTSDEYVSTNFGLHGLWPNKTSCKKNYGFCDKAASQPAEPGRFCDLPELSWSESTKEMVQQYMLSVKYNTCLERHEWWKHGTCSGYSVDDYFALSVSLVDEINKTAFVDFIRNNIGKLITRDQLYVEFDNVFGANARQYITLVCQGKKGESALQEIQIHLPKTIARDQAVQDMLKQSTPAVNKGNCAAEFMIRKAA